MASSDTAHDPRLTVPDHLCASCGAPLAADQRYCLNCGRPLNRREDLLRALAPSAAHAASTERLAATAVPAAPARTVTPWGAAAAVALLLLAGLTGAVIAGDPAPPAPQVRVAAAPQPDVNVTVPAGGAGAAAAAELIGDWPGDDGWTVQLRTLPKDASDPAAVARAKTEAESAGAKDVGALDSDEYPSLDPGEYVVYSGVFDTKKAAAKALRGLRKDFPDAKVVKVAASGSAPKVEKSASKQSDKELEELQNAGGEDFVKKSRKLKDKVGTEGAAPKTDDKAPGGGDGGGAVIE